MMEQKIKISVIVPIYNAERYLKQCLNSICNQTLHEIEIICVDDGSTDNSITLLNKFKDKDNRIRLLFQQNAGGGIARNKGLEIARGEYILFLDADDFFESDMCETIYNNAIKNNSDIVIFKANKFNMKTQQYISMDWAFQTKYFKSEIFSYKDAPDRIFNCFQNFLWNKLFSRQFINKNGVKFQELHRTNDLFFVCATLILAERISTVNKVFTHYRIGQENNCQATNDLYPLDFYYAFTRLKDFLIEKNVYSDVKKSFVNWAFEGCIYNLLSLNDYTAFKTVYEHLKAEGFKKLDLEPRTIEYYYYPNRYSTFMDIWNKEITQYLFDNVKAKEINTDIPLGVYFTNDDYCKKIRELEIKIKKLEHEINNIYHSKTYCLGKILLHFPRKLRNIFLKK